MNDIDGNLAELDKDHALREDIRLLGRLLGDTLPLGEIYLPSDPPRMFKVVKAVKKPCLVYKVLV